MRQGINQECFSVLFIFACLAAYLASKWGEKKRQKKAQREYSRYSTELWEELFLLSLQQHMDRVDLGWAAELAHEHQICLTLGLFPRMGLSLYSPTTTTFPISWRGRSFSCHHPRLCPQHRKRWNSLHSLSKETFYNQSHLVYFRIQHPPPLPSKTDKVKGITFPQSPGGSLGFSGWEISPQVPHWGIWDNWECVWEPGQLHLPCCPPQPSRSIFLSPQGIFSPKEQTPAVAEMGQEMREANTAVLRAPPEPSHNKHNFFPLLVLFWSTGWSQAIHTPLKLAESNPKFPLGCWIFPPFHLSLNQPGLSSSPCTTALIH